MLYAITPAAVLILNLILNWELFKNYGFHAKKTDRQKQARVRYNWFLLASCCYFVVDMCWGLLYERREVDAFFPYIYWLTVFYFMFMLFTMLAWTRYMLSSLGNGGWRSKVLLHLVWALAVFGMVCLVLNHSYHFMFSYNDQRVYVGEVGRNLTFLFQIAFYVLITIYMLCVAHNSVGSKKTRCVAVAATSAVLGTFLTFQIVNAFFPFYATGLMIGICLVHSFVQASEKKEKEVHDYIASAMAEDYEAIFYVDLDSGEYLAFSKSQKYMTLDATANGKDFFKDAQANIEGCVYPEDWEYARSFYSKEAMLKNLEGKRSFSFKYRVMINNEPRFFLFTAMRESDSQYLIFYEKDIDDELMAEKRQKESQKKTVTFGQIAESLASLYDVIYYVNVADSSFVCYKTNDTYGNLEINDFGDDFYGESLSNIPLVIHEHDREKLSDFINKDNMISTMETHKDCNITYRMMVSGNPQYTRMTVRKSSDGSHFIIGIENVDAEIKKEKQHLKELKTEKELARRDDLTGVKNKTAYRELEASVQGNIDNGLDYLNFALVVCDSNNLKLVNDTKGHAAGDEYIRASAALLCGIFIHSPVFRVGGDEFVVFLRGNDYSARHELMEKLRGQALENLKTNGGAVLASGMAEYLPESDSFVSEIFERADKDMYDDKARLKSIEA